MIPHTSLFVKAELMDQIGLYNTKYQISGDYDFILRLLSLKLKYRWIDDTLVEMASGGASNGSLRKEFVKFIEDFKVLLANGIAPFPAVFLKKANKINQYFYRSP
jgi:glycosyltransferase